MLDHLFPDGLDILGCLLAPHSLLRQLPETVLKSIQGLQDDLAGRLVCLEKLVDGVERVLRQPFLLQLLQPPAYHLEVLLCVFQVNLNAQNQAQEFLCIFHDHVDAARGIRG